MNDRKRSALAFVAGIPTIGVAFAISITLHAIPLTITFVMPHQQRDFKDKALEIVLVNSKSKTRPHEAQVLAQANLDGGGNVDENRRAKTPLPPARNSKSGDRLEEAQRRVRELEARQRELMTQAKPAPPVTVSRDTPREAVPDTPQPVPAGRDLASSALAMVRLQAEIDRNVDEYNKRPRKMNIGVRAAEYRFARYREDWRLKVERIGTLNYPEAARGKLYGNLLLTVTIDADGKVVEVAIDRSSGKKILDEAARRIVQMAGPYAAFSPDIRREYDQIEITANWSFTRGDAIEATPR